MSESTAVHVLSAARLLFHAGDVVEIRVPKGGRQKTISGYFDELEKLAEVTAELERMRLPGIYWTLNPVNRALLSRAANRYEPYAKTTTSDADVLRRQLLGLDFDPKRPAGISSTEREHSFALQLAEQVREDLMAAGWPEPIFADSGNGAHLVYPIELPNDPESAELLKRILAALAARYDTPAVEVDKTTFNASRIFKVYGTTARKGDNTQDRPHRLSHILQVPALLAPVPLDLLRALASTAPTSEEKRHQPAASGRSRYSGHGGAQFTIEQFLSRHGIRYLAPVAHEGGRKFVLEECPWDPNHKAPDSAVFELADGSFGFKCFHNSCHGRQWRDLRELFEGTHRHVPPPSRASAIPNTAPANEDKVRDSDKIPLSAGDVEAAIDAAITAKDLPAALLLIPDIARLPSQSQVLIQAKLRLKFKREFPVSDYRRSIKEWMEKYAAPPDPPDDDGADPLPDAPDLLGYPLTDSGNGERIVALYPDTIRYCVEFKKWLVWDGQRWKRDDGDLIISQKAKAMARTLHEQAVRCQDIEPEMRKVIRAHARDSESQPSIMKALKRAASEPGMCVAASDLDMHRYLLNCLNGVVDVRTGELLQSDPKYLITKLCHVKYVPNAKCNRFLKLLNWAMGEDPEDDGEDRPGTVARRERTARLLDYLQKTFGYCLTGDVSEKAAFIFYGKKGNNGKTTLLTTFTTILAEYATILDINTLMTSKFTDNNVRADMAKLHGARLAITSEIDDGQRLSERLLKYLTQGMGKITACRKFENPFEFDATHKLIMDANYRPEVKGGDEAIWGRLKCVDFNQRIEDDDPTIDKKLINKLLAESEGILAWAVRGAMRWATDGKLGAPPEVKEATKNWRDDDDPLKEFLEDCCEIDLSLTGEDALWVLGSDLSQAYAEWTKRNTESRPLTRRKLSERLEQCGFRKNRSRRDAKNVQMRTWEGLSLKMRVTSQSSRFDDSGN